ncbi:putative auxin efflux carrier component 8 [Panicum miliaceum]|uniref:Auxin efflux carrier component 8 n=1 Tax=Panicum miliaceum TaxID=4540 RepID=A0A3L6QQN6_PANMI|nr:putative auxin efflux carrier component 8 [Panicum miliaceum]
MIGWGDVYKVAAAMAPLYFALALGYGSVRWWKVFTRDQCGAINRLVIYFAFPFFGFDLTARAGFFAASYRVLAADVACKALVVLALAGWATPCRWSSKKGGGGGGGGSSRSYYSWCITGFSLAALNNALLMGIPLLDAMYGEWAHDIAVQMSMMQIVVWFRWCWSCSRWHLELPSIVEGSVTIMSKTGIGLGMFSMGLFIALQDKFIICGPGLTALSLGLRFVAGPAAAALGLRGDLLRFAIVQLA